MAGFADPLSAFQLGFVLLAFALAVSGIDDAVLDAGFHLRRLWRRFTVYRRHSRLTAEQLPAGSQQRIAILIPTWREADVIARMLANLRATLLYRHYHVFLGYYPNDPATAEQTAPLVKEDDNWLDLVVMPRRGPTNKADCLNHLYARMTAFEAETETPFDIVILHDAEDVIHPLEAIVFNHLIPEKAMVQLPVVPLERPLTRLVGGHYLDEFAEMHGKDLVVREAVIQSTPSAGVGCAFRRSVLADLASDDAGPLHKASLTEDYDLALRLARAGEPTVFVQIPATDPARGRRDLVATREYFPDRFGAAIRQKARWYIGIAFQAWRDHAWRGSTRQKYGFLRDRKAVWASLLVLAGYLLALLWLGWWLAYRLGAIDSATSADPTRVFALFPLQVLLGLNVAFLVNRMVHRIWAVAGIYGPAQGLMSVVRLPVSNVVNALAAMRAIALYLRHRLTGKQLTWQKTDHDFPDDQSLQPFRARIGQILMQQGHVTPADIDEALAIQNSDRRPLGELLLARGLITPGDLERALDRQQAISRDHAR